MSSYTDSMCYETFICRAFKCDYDSHNSKNSYFQNLIDLENSPSLMKKSASYEKQLAFIKQNIDKAIDKFLKSKPTPLEASSLNELKQKLSLVRGSSEIKDLLNQGLLNTKRFIL